MSQTLRTRLGRIGIWSGQLRRADPAGIVAAAPVLEDLGYTTLWIPGGRNGDPLGDAERLLGITETVNVAMGVLNIWKHPPAESCDAQVRLNSRYGGRFTLGLGVSHEGPMRSEGIAYGPPLGAMRTYLAALDAEPIPVRAHERVIAALGPRMLGLAREAAAGALTYFVPPEHTVIARQVLGDDRLLAVEQMVVLDARPEVGRGIARKHMANYLRLPNYCRNLLRLGFDDADLVEGGSDRLVDAIVAWGDEQAIRAHFERQFVAGADHVCAQVLIDDAAALPEDGWRRLADIVVQLRVETA